jgi:hypothetical protein
MRDQAYAEAAARREARLADPYQDEQYANQEAEAYAAYYSALDQAGGAWAAAEQAAYDEWQAAMNAAESTFTQTESQAWGRYIECLDELNSQLEHTRLILEAAFQTAWNNFVRDWTEMESAAWDAYQRARTQVLQQPPEGQRQVGPPPLDVLNLLVMQLGAEARVAQNRPLRGEVQVNPLAIKGNAGDTFTVTLAKVPNGSRIETVEIVGGSKINWQPNGPLSGTVTLQGNFGPVIPNDPDTGLPRPHVRIWVWYIQPDGTRRLAVGSIGIAR